MPLEDIEAVEIKDDMSEEDIKMAEEYLKAGEEKVEKFFETQENWERNGIDLTQVSEGARSDIEKIGKEAWLGIRREETLEFQKDLKEAKTRLGRAKKKLAKTKPRKKQA